jgi:2-aminomuconate deaminase
MTGTRQTMFRTRKAITLREKAPAPLGCYSHAVQAGPYLYLCGLGARDPETGSEVGVTLDVEGNVVFYDIGVQTHAVIRNLVTVLEAAGCTLRDLVDVTVFLADMKDFAAYNKVYAEYFNFDGPPVRTTIQALPPGRNFIEIKAIAWCTEDDLNGEGV